MLSFDKEGYNVNGDIRMENAVVKTEKILSAIVGVDYDYICLINVKTRLYEMFTGHEGERIPQKNNDYDAERTHNTAIYIVEEDRQRLLQEMDLDYVSQQLEKNEKYSTEYRMCSNAGQRYKQDTFFYLDETHQYIVLMRKDVTQLALRQQDDMDRLRKALIELEKANDAKSVFLSNMSHDLRTPLNGILGFADIGIRDNDIHHKQDALEKIKISGELLLDLVNDTLELSRIESGKVKLEPEVVESKGIGRSILVSIHQLADQKGIHFIADTEKFPQGKIYVDRLKLQKIVLNLLSNAVKYTPKGGTVKYTVEAIEPPVNHMNRRIIVEDNGIGMSPEFLNHLYEPFVQERREEARNIQGTGLGLTIVKVTVDLMGGTIDVKSTVGKGTKFTVALPLECPLDAIEEKHEEQAHYDFHFQGRHVLLCEDNAMNAEIATVLLKQQDIKVDCAVNGQEGVAKFNASPIGCYDAVLMDIRMPVMNGYDATKAIRRLKRKDAKTVSIIAMTADAFEESVKASKEAGMDDYLTKPVEPKRLYEMLAKHILK